ncbi:MAG: signal peptidase I [Lachnospiraceae bacterium]|nr:signal peptidase I [Lachnospiraceae bacterium]
MVRSFLVVEAAVAAAAVMFLYLAGYRFYIVRSGSMEPFIHTGSMEIVDCRSRYYDIQTGDVVCFASAGGMPVIHRVAHVTENGLETKGDANDISDGITVIPENYIGKAVFQIPYAGYAAVFAASKKGRIAIITAIAVLLIITLFPVRDSKTRKRLSAELPRQSRMTYEKAGGKCPEEPLKRK